MKNCSLLLLFVFASCAQIPAEGPRVNFPFSAELLEKVKHEKSRMPASELKVDEVEGKSTRRTYFTALYHQYLTLGQHLEKASQIGTCPAFHHDKVETDTYAIPKVSTIKSKFVSREGKSFFPELAFENDFSMEDYYASVETEVQTLCEEGLSDNFYKFDNFVTHHAGRDTFQGKPEAMQAVLKIPVFANYFLLRHLLPMHQVAFAHPDEKRVIDLTRTYWFERYVTIAQGQRDNFIKHAMAQRDGE